MSTRYLEFGEFRKRVKNFKKIVEEHNLSKKLAIDEKEEKFLEENPLAPIIATICNQQISAEYAWRFSYWLNEQLDEEEFSAEVIYQMGKEKVKEIL